MVLLTVKYVLKVKQQEVKLKILGNLKILKTISDFEIIVEFYSFGESGSPLQFRSKHDIKNDEYDSNYISTMYETSTLIGIQSFSTSCALDIPSVYTKLDAYREWMRSEIKNTN